MQRLLPVLLASLAIVWADDAQWINVGPVINGSVAFLTFDRQNAGTIYGATGVGLFKSTDGGATWNNAGLIGRSVVSLIIDARNPSTLYASTGDTSGQGIATNQVFTSSDGGATWTEADAGLPATVSCCTQLLATDPQNTTTLYAFAGAPREVFKSTDGGANWAATSGLPGRLNFVNVTVDPQNAGTLYAEALGADSSGHQVIGVFRSRDGGTSWNEADAGLPGVTGLGGDFYAPGGIVVDPVNSSNVYVTRMDSGVWKSTNGGVSWRTANSGLPNEPGEYQFISCCIAGMVVDPQTPGILYAPGATGAIFKSTNGGGSWFTVNAGKGRGWLGEGMPWVIDPYTSTSYAGSGSGMFSSKDGGATWDAANISLRASAIPSLAPDPQNAGTLYAGGLKSTDAGMSWFPANAGLGPGSVAALAIDPTSTSTVYAGTNVQERDDDGDILPCAVSSVSGIFKSVDGGMSWMDTQVGIGCVSAIAIDPQNPGTVYAGSQHAGVYRSTDGGMTWGAVNLGLPSGPEGIAISAVTVDPQNSGTVYAASDGGLLKSTDSGASWSDTGLTPVTYSLAIDPQDPGTLYAATSNGLFKSGDGGMSWANVLPATSYAVAVNPQAAGTIYAGTDAGVAQSMDGGASWATIAGGPEFVRLLALNPQDPNRVYAGGTGGLFTIRVDVY